MILKVKFGDAEV